MLIEEDSLCDGDLVNFQIMNQKIAKLSQLFDLISKVQGD